jgi:hypothetical protein
MNVKQLLIVSGYTVLGYDEVSRESRVAYGLEREFTCYKVSYKQLSALFQFDWIESEDKRLFRAIVNLFNKSLKGDE